MEATNTRIDEALEREEIRLRNEMRVSAIIGTGLAEGKIKAEMTGNDDLVAAINEEFLKNNQRWLIARDRIVNVQAQIAERKEVK